MATVVARYPPKPNQTPKSGDNPCRGLGCGTPTSFMPPDCAAKTVQVMTLWAGVNKISAQEHLSKQSYSFNL